jgi:hypothetical protein
MESLYKWASVGTILTLSTLLFAVNAYAATVTNESNLTSALIDNTVDTITLGSDITLTSPVLVNRSVVIDGSGKKFSATFSKSNSADTDHNAAIIVTSPNVTIKNLVVDGTVGGQSWPTQLHGINIYQSANVLIDTVTVSNFGGAGINVNGSVVTATNLITNGNKWGSVNIDPGLGVNTASVFTLNSGTLSESNQIWSDGTNVTGTATVAVHASGFNKYSVGGKTTPFYIWTSNPLTNSATISKNSVITVYPTIQAAIDASSDGDTIQLASDMSISTQINVTKSITIDGQGHKLTAPFSKVGTSNNAALGIINTNGAVVIKNLTEDGADSTKLHGINIYNANNVTLDNVTVSNNTASGVTVNSSNVTVNNIITKNNTWGGINADQASTAPTVLTINGTSSHTETNADIWVDNNTKNVTVNDVNSQYSHKTYTSGPSIIGTAYKLLQVGQTTPDNTGNATVTSTNTKVVVTSTTTPISVTSGDTTNASIDFNSLLSGSSVTTPQTTINSTMANVSIPSGTIISGTGWTGTLDLPTKGSSSGDSAPSGFSVGSNVISVGDPNITLTFSQPVKLTLNGVTGPVGYRSAGSNTWTQITNQCTSASVPGITSGECYATSGGNTVIWTYHFTSFGNLVQNSLAIGSSRQNVSSISASPTTGASVQGEVLGAETVSPEIQTKIDSIKTQLRSLIQQLIAMLQAEIVAQRGY